MVHEELRNEYHKSIDYIMLGIILNIMSFNFYYLQYILPTIGIVLLYVGFRELKNENKYFKISWIFSIVNLILQVLTIIYLSTPLNAIEGSNFYSILIQTIFQLTFLLINRKAINELYSVANEKSDRDPILGIIFFRISALVSVFIGVGSTLFIVISITIWYIYLVKAILNLGADLRKMDYIAKVRLFKLNSRIIIASYLIICLISIGITSTVSNHIKLNATSYTMELSSETKRALINKGFPKEVIADMENKEVEFFKDAISIDSHTQKLVYDNSTVYIQSDLEDDKAIIDGKVIKVTSVFVQLKDNSIYAIEHFNWINCNSYWRDGININTIVPLELIKGKLLYEQDDKKYEAPIPNLNLALVNSNDFRNPLEEDERIIGDINYPFGATNKRGYILYKLNISNGYTSGTSIVNYMHYSHPFRFPYTPNEKMNLGFTDSLRQHVSGFSTINKN